MIHGLYACDALHQLRVVALNVFDERVLLGSRTGDEDRACVADRHGRLVKKVLIF
jgi:hypothetical protein